MIAGRPDFSKELQQVKSNLFSDKDTYILYYQVRLNKLEL